MRLHMRGRNTNVTPHMLGWIAEWFEKLNTPYEDIVEARVTMVKRRADGRDLAHVQLMLAGRTLHMTQGGATLHEAVEAALQSIASMLHDIRARRRGFRKPPTFLPEATVPASYEEESV